MHRILIVGTTSAGKTTLAEKISQRINIPVIDLDALRWLPNWQMMSGAELCARLQPIAAQDCWIITGNASATRDITWSRADTLIWLDYPLRVVLWRLFWRTVKRIITRENLWGTGNRETWRKAFASKDSLFLWAIKTHPKFRQDFPAQFARFPNLTVIHHRTPAETERWLAQLEQSSNKLQQKDAEFFQ